MSIKYAILGLLHYRDMHGYEIKNRIEKNFGYTWTVNYGQIYTSLKALVEEGNIVLSEVVTSEAGTPPKKLYSLTDKGREDFGRWLGRSPQKKLLHRDPFMMRFIFFALGKPEDALKLIDEQIRLHEQLLEQRKESMADQADRGPYVALARELGITHNRSRVEWLKKARDMILKTKRNKTGKKVKTRRS